MLQRLKSLGLLGMAIAGLGCTGAIDGGAGRSNPPGGGGSNTNPGNGNVGPGNGNVGPGNNGGNGSNGSGNPGTPIPIPPPPNLTLPSDDATVPGVDPLRRLTLLEYQNTVRDLLGVTDIPAARLAAFSSDQDSGLSGFVRGGSITAAPDARNVMQAAEDLAQLALGRMQSLLPCNPVPAGAAEQDACADKFIAGFGKRAYRRPLQQAEIDDLRGLYKAQRAADIGADFNKAIANVIAAMLQSPYFLYRFERGPAAPVKDGNLVRFSQYEVASRLSYLLWASMPDDRLFEAADKGELKTPDQIATEARRMLFDVKTREALVDFHSQWLNLGGLADMPKDVPAGDYSPEVAKSMYKETREFLASVFHGAKADGRLETLLTSPATFVDGNLAKIYGVKNVTGAEMQPVTLDPTQRAGILTQATFLATKADAVESHPIKRGDQVLGHLLCMKLEIPADLDVPPLPEPKPGQTTRERNSVHSASPCATCHKWIDPLGFSFEHYDVIGRYRTTEEGKPVDASGAFPLGNDTITFKSAVELIPALAKSQEARDCMVTQWSRYALRRQVVDTEAPSMNLVREAFKQSNYDLRELIIAFTRTRAFSHRTPSPQEVLQ
jgi:hypothetical protein